jgi:hypothetical protein
VIFPPKLSTEKKKAIYSAEKFIHSMLGGGGWRINSTVHFEGQLVTQVNRHMMKNMMLNI